LRADGPELKQMFHKYETSPAHPKGGSCKR
jgi:hypothetical protein